MLPFLKIQILHLAVVYRQLRQVVYVAQLHLLLVSLQKRRPVEISRRFLVVVLHIVEEHFGDEGENVFFEDLGGIVVVGGEGDHLLYALLVFLLEQPVADEF